MDPFVREPRRVSRVIGWMLGVGVVAGGVAVPFLLATELDPRIGIPAAIVVGLGWAGLLAVVIAYGRRRRPDRVQDIRDKS